MKSLAALLFCASVALAQMQANEPVEDVCGTGFVVAGTVVSSDPAVGTNAKRPTVVVDVSEVLKGDLKPGRISVRWDPEPLLLECGNGAEHAIAEWNARPLKGPAAGEKVLLGLQLFDETWSVVPSRIVPDNEAEHARVVLTIKESARKELETKAKFVSRQDCEIVAMLLLAWGGNTIQLNKETGDAYLRHTGLWSQVKRLEIVDYPISDEGLAAILEIAGFEEPEGSFDSIRDFNPRLKHLKVCQRKLDFTTLNRIALSQIPVTSLHVGGIGEDSMAYYSQAAELPFLRKIRIGQLTSDDARALAESESITSIISDSDGGLLEGACQALESLTTLEELVATIEPVMTVADAEALASLPHLLRLEIGASKVEPAAFLKLRAIETFSMSGADDEALTGISTMTALRTIRLSDLHLRNDKSLLELGKLEGVVDLYLDTATMTEGRKAVVEELKKMMPNTTIRQESRGRRH